MRQMKPLPLIAGAATLILLATCAAPGPQLEAVAAEPVVEAGALWNFSAAEDDIRAASCSGHSSPPVPFSELLFEPKSLEPGQIAELSKRLPEGAKLAGAWGLTADDPNFGGISGIALGEGGLIGVTDAGGWVGISITNGKPRAATLAYMRSAKGTYLSGKIENDAEDIAWRDGIAIVSFERDFRIEAFDLGGCGSAAKAVRVADLPDEIGGKDVDSNSGPEGMTLTPDGALRFGYEGVSDSNSPLGEVLKEGTGRWTGISADNPSGFALTGMDTVRLATGEDRDVLLFRAFDPIRGARAVVVWGPGEDQRATLSRPVLTDNFEGIAAEPLEDGRLRLWIVSDDNFSTLQRTLLYAIDVTP